MDHHPYLWLVVIGLLLYSRTLSFSLVIDDLEWQRRIKSGFLTQHPFYILYSHWGFPAPIEHAITLTLHILTACLLCKATTPIAAVLFLCHPCNHQTAVWLTGRRYSIFNILVLTMVLFHVWWLLPLVAIPIALFAKKQLAMRMSLAQIPGSPLETLRTVLMKLTGIGSYECKYSHLYPDGPSPFLPHTQPCAERYLSLPLLLTCSLLAQTPLAYPLIALYSIQTLRLLPMYRSIQDFYNYHLPLIPVSKLALLKRLYPEIKT